MTEPLTDEPIPAKRDVFDAIAQPLGKHLREHGAVKPEDAPQLIKRMLGAFNVATEAARRRRIQTGAEKHRQWKELSGQRDALRAALDEANKSHDETIGSYRRYVEGANKRVTLLTEQCLRLTKERDRYREGLVVVSEYMGGANGDQGWNAPEDVWGIANKALGDE